MTKPGISIIACLLALPLSAVAQDAAISGMVADQTGGVLPGVTVEAAGPALADGPRVTVTDGTGRYTFSGLPAGDYSISFSLSSFETARRDGVTVGNADSVTLDAELQFASFSEDVTVVGSKLDTGRQEFGTSVAYLSAERLDIDAIFTVEDAFDRTANAFTGTAGFGAYSIRGVNNTGLTTSFSRANALASVLLNQTALGPLSSDYLKPSLFDASSVEILRGPQSTLQGPNSLIGSVLINYNKPAFDGYHGRVRFERGAGSARRARPSCRTSSSSTTFSRRGSPTRTARRTAPSPTWFATSTTCNGPTSRPSACRSACGPAPTIPGVVHHDLGLHAVEDEVLELGVVRYDEGFMGFMLRLHVELFAGLPGTLFLGVMSMVFLAALVSGVVLYAPFMRERAFAVIRLDQGPRTRWFDLHNALGIVLMVWIFVVSLTGIINTWGFPMIQYWQIAEMQGLIADDDATAADTGGRLSSLDEAVAVGLEARPGRSLLFAVYPGTELSSPDHYILFSVGDEPLSSRLFQPVIVNAWSGEMIAAPDMPWYITMLLLSQPLHFSDYGGLGLKIAWALLDVGMIIVLWSGLVLWWRKRAEMPEIDLVASGAPA